MRLGFCHSLITQWTIPSLPSTAVIVTFTDTLGKWPRTLGLVRNYICTCGKQKNKKSTWRWDRSIAETPRDTWPVPLKSYDGQWNPGGSPSLSRQRVPCITIADVCLLDYTVMLRSAWMPAEETRARVTPSSWISRCICRLVKEHKCINFKHRWSQWGKLLTVAELLPPTQTNMTIKLLLYKCRCCMQEWNTQ